MRIRTLVTIAMFTGAPLTAQVAGPPQTVLEPHLHSGQLIRLRVRGVMMTGNLVALGRDSVTVRSGDGQRTVPTAGIDQVWVRGHATLTGTLIGAALGLVGGALIAAAVSESGEGGSVSADDRNDMLLGGAVGAAVGAGLGALAGSLIPKWKQRYP